MISAPKGKSKNKTKPLNQTTSKVEEKTKDLEGFCIQIAFIPNPPGKKNPTLENRYNAFSTVSAGNIQNWWTLPVQRKDDRIESNDKIKEE